MSLIDNFKERGMTDSVTQKEVSTLVKVAIPASIGATVLSVFKGEYFFAFLMFMFLAVLVGSLVKMNSNGGFNEQANILENYGTGLKSESKDKYDAILNGEISEDQDDANN